MAAAFVLATAGAVLAQAPAAAPPPDGLPDGPGKDVVARVCTACHEASTFTGRARTPQDWEFVIGRMIDGGAEMTGDEQEAVYAYLVKNYGKPAETPPPGAAPPGSVKTPPGR
jgi:hypothetical protein